MLVITLPQWLQPFFGEPGIILWAAFGIIPSMIVLGIFIKITRTSQFMTPVIYALLITWPIGFLTVIVGIFSGITTQKLGLIWLIIFCGMLIFNIVFRRSIDKFSTSLDEAEKPTAQKQTTNQSKKKKRKNKH